jgi:hypothetical protein
MRCASKLLRFSLAGPVFAGFGRVGSTVRMRRSGGAADHCCRRNSKAAMHCCLMCSNGFASAVFRACALARKLHIGRCLSLHRANP